MSKSQIKSKILNVSGVEFIVPENFELVKDLSRTLSKKIVAINSISKKKYFVEKLNFDSEFTDDLQFEVASLLAHIYLGSLRVVKLCYLMRPEDFDSSKYIFKIVEYMEVSLNSVIKSSQKLTSDHVRYFLYQILIHIHYLHSHSLSLTYFTPKSFLVNSDCKLKLSKPLYEFRMNCNRINQIEQYHDDNDHTRWYLPPEYFIDKDLTLKSDMWSLGCIFYELVARKPLFTGSDYKKMIISQIEGLGKLDQSDIDLVKNETARRFLMRSQFKWNYLFDSIEGVCEDGMNIFRNLMVFDPDKRMSAVECLMHPYFEKIFVTEDLRVEIKSFDRVFDALFMDRDQIFWRLKELFKQLEV